MKTTRFLLVSLFVIAFLSVNAQSKSYKMYDVFSGRDGVTNFTFSKNDDDKNVTGDLHQIKFMSFNPKKGNMSGPEFTKRAIKLLPSQYKKYVDDDEDSDAIIYLLGGKKKYTECHVFTTNEHENQLRIIVSFYGDFNVSDIDELKKKGKEFSDE